MIELRFNWYIRDTELRGCLAWELLFKRCAVFKHQLYPAIIECNIDVYRKIKTNWKM